MFVRMRLSDPAIDHINPSSRQANDISEEVYFGIEMCSAYCRQVQASWDRSTQSGTLHALSGASALWCAARCRAVLRGDAPGVQRAADPLYGAGINAAILRTPGRPGLASADLIAASILGRWSVGQAASPRSWPSPIRHGPVPGSSSARTRQRRPSFGTSPCLQAWLCRAPAGVGTGRS